MDRQTIWAESMRKMFLAMADDIRVVLIKLADRLHNMRTLDARPPEKRKRVAQETMDIYAPLAARLGIGQIKWQLEDLSFRHLEPAIYKDIARQLSHRRIARERYIAQVIETLDGELKKLGITADITGRPKHIFSIYRKMRARQAEISQIYDLLAVRVLVDTLPECYSVLGQIHAIWRPIPGQFDDYIANRKESGYQSLHTTVVAMEGQPLEIQIRTHEMHQVAEYGVAAHWRYKEGRRADVQFDAKVAWLRQLMDWQRDVSAGAQAFVDSLKTDVFQDQVYVFTPRGEIKEMADGATPLDFAYRVHTEVGHKCVGAKVNGRMVPLDHKLQNGDIVEIITARGSKGPSRDWLNPNLGYIGTANAREKIRQWFKRQQRDENVQRGRELVDKELKRLSIDGVKLDDIASTFKYEQAGRLPGGGRVRRHPPAPDRDAHLERDEAACRSGRAAEPSAGLGAKLEQRQGARRRRLADAAGAVLQPRPRRRHHRLHHPGQGRHGPSAVVSSVENEEDQERLVQVDWGRTGQSMFPVTVRIEAWDRVGLARDIAALLADEGLSITDLDDAGAQGPDGGGLGHHRSGRPRQAEPACSTASRAMRDVFSVVREVGKAPTNGRA